MGSVFKLLAPAAAAVAGAAFYIPSPGVHAADSGYVDARLCATCHSQIASDYAMTGMGRAFFRPAASNTLEDYLEDAHTSYYHAESNTYFGMTRRDGGYYQRRWQIGLAGNPINIEELKIDYVMGSGNHARSYLHRTDRGTLIELPLGWYSEGGGHWGMSPGSDSDHPRTRRFISYKCMFCHNRIPQLPPKSAAPGADPVFTGALPEGIDCQRCHGPGARHLRTVATPTSSLAEVRASIVNPARLSPRLRMEICMQCHMQTSSGRIPSQIVRFDRQPFSFVPGEPLDNFMLAFDHAPGTGHDGKFEAVSSVYRLRQSRCFQQSEGRLTCDTCHDPHRVPRGAAATAAYSAACLKCHSAQQGAVRSVATLAASGAHPASGDCIACHMPKRRAEDTPGMIMTDHLIQRRPPAGNLLANFREAPAEEYHGEVVPYYPAPFPKSPENNLYLAVAQVGLGNNLKAGLPVLAREITRQKPRQAEFYLTLADAWQSAGNSREAIAAYRQAVQLSPESLHALRSLAAALSAAGQSAQAAEILKRAVELAQSDAISWYRYGMLDYDAGHLDLAAAKIRKAIALDPSLPEQSRSLAEVLAKSGQHEQAEAAVREALRTDPYDDGAWDLAGRILTEKGELPEALFDFQNAIRLRPGHAPHLHDYALALVRADRFDDAQAQAETALRTDPNLADTHELLGGLLLRKKQLAEAAHEYRRVLELRPDSNRAHLRLGNVLAAQGDSAGAVEHWRVAARAADPAIAQLAAAALRQMGAR